MKRVLFSAAIVAFVASIANAAESPARAQIHGVFDQWDLNGDGKLDAAELAKGLRGKNAQVIPHAEPAKPGPEKHPDHVFMTRFDKNKDSLISRDEFELWERDVAAEQKRVQEQLKRAQRNRRHRR